MANKIGNYIHYHKSNYIKYGIGVKTPNKQNFSFTSYRQQMLKRLKDNNIQTFCKKYQKVLNDWYRDKKLADANQKKYQIKQQELVEKINQVLFSEFNTADDYVQATENGFKLYGKGQKSGLIYSKGQVTTQNQNRTTSVQQQTLLKYIIDLLKIADNLLKYNDRKHIQNKLSHIGSTVSKLKSVISKNPAISKYLFDKNDSLTGILSEVVKCYNYDFSLNDSIINGQIGEVAGAFAANFVANQGNVNLQKLYKQTIKSLSGGKVSSPALQINNTTGMNQVFSRRFALGYSEWNMKQNPTQNKADISVTFKNKPMNISFKNYNADNYFFQTKGITTTSPTSLLTYLVDENTDFINHWLNLVAYSPGDVADNSLTAQRIKYHNIMKLILLVKSIRGAKGRQGNANIFAVNLRSGTSNNFKVLSIYDIVNKITLSQTLSGVKIVGLQDRYAQRWHGYNRDMEMTPYRISGLLDEIKNNHISVHLLASSGLF